MTNATHITKNYYASRLAEIGLNPKDGPRHGLKCGENGEIIQIVRHFNGQPIEFTPQFGKAARQLRTVRARRADYNLHESQFVQPLTITRHTPAQVAAGLPRYKFTSKKYSGLGVKPMPTTAAIDAYNSQATGGTIVAVEGYLKAVKLSLHGVEAFAFSGNTVYNLDDGVKRYLLRRRPENLILLYDNDAREVKSKDGKVSSSRVQGFYNSAWKFARDLFNFCKQHGLEINLHFSTVAEGLDTKGVDDLMVANPDPDEVVNSFLSFRSSQYFHFMRLFPTSFERRLSQYFHLDNHKDFYGSYAAQIAGNPFAFQGFDYLRKPVGAGNLFDQKPVGDFFTLLDSPHDNPLEEVVKVQVNKFLAERGKDLDDVIFSAKKVAIDAPTGSAKSSYFLGYKKGGSRKPGLLHRKRRLKAVFAVPYVGLAKQLARESGFFALHGNMTREKKERALNARVVICTYDVLPHMTDIASRWLIVDEAHDLINQYGELLRGTVEFRAATLRRIVERFQLAQKTILLSGTMPRMLCKAFGFKLVEVLRRKSPTVNITAIEAENSKTPALTAALLTQLRKVDKSKVSFVLYDNVAQLDAVKENLITSGVFAADEIEVITRPHLDDGESETYKEIIQTGKISRCKLILCTCLLAEGISIKNKDIGQIFTVGVDDLDKFRQFVARFRAVNNINVTSILPPEKSIKPCFRYAAVHRFEMYMDSAVAQLSVYRRHQKRFLAEYDKSELPYLDNILPQYEYSGHNFHWLHVPDGGGATVDTLKILATIQQEIRNEANNAYLYSQLLRCDGFRIAGIDETPPNEDDRQAAQTAAKQQKKDKAETLDGLKSALVANPSAVVSAYHYHAGKSQNRYATAFIQKTAADLLTDDDSEALAFYTEHRQHFRYKWFTALIRAFLRLHWAGFDREALTKEINDYKQFDFAQKWRSLMTCVEALAYGDRQTRKHLTPLHKLEIRTREGIRRKLTQLAQDGGGLVTTDAAQAAINDLLRFKRYGEDCQETQTVLRRYSKAETERLIETLFQVEKTQFVGFAQYRILGQFLDDGVVKLQHIFDIFTTRPVPDLLNNPLKIIELRKE